MRFALDRFGDEVDAYSVSPFTGPLACPTCGQGVYHKRGWAKSPHFAHFEQPDGWDCEQYFPGAGGSTDVLSGLLEGARRASARWVGARLCVDGRRKSSLQLVLRLPTGWLGRDLERVVIQTKTYQIVVHPDSAAKSSFVTLPWRAPVGSCVTVPRDPEIEGEVNTALAELEFEGNLFRATGDVGSILSPLDELEMGKCYWLITQRKGRLEQLPSSVAVKPAKINGLGWQAYHVALPSEAYSLSDVSRIEAILGHRVKEPLNNPRLVWPVPAELTPDGGIVFGEDVDEVVIQTTLERPSIELSGFKAGNVPPTVVENSGLLRFQSLSADVYELRVDGIIEMSLTIEPVAPLRPLGVALVVNDTRQNLFELRSYEVIEGESARIDVPHLRCWNLLSRPERSRLDSHDTQKLHPPPGPLLLDFASFGRLIAWDDESDEDGSPGGPEVATGLRHVPAFINGIVLARASSSAASSLRAVTTFSECLQWASRYDLEWLLPTLRRAMEWKE